MAGAGVITAPANALYSIVFEATGIHDMGTQFANGSRPLPTPLDNIESFHNRRRR